MGVEKFTEKPALGNLIANINNNNKYMFAYFCLALLISYILYIQVFSIDNYCAVCICRFEHFEQSDNERNCEGHSQVQKPDYLGHKKFRFLSRKMRLEGFQINYCFSLLEYCIHYTVKWGGTDCQYSYQPLCLYI